MTKNNVWPSEDDAENANFKPLTADEARQLREKQPPLSPWRVVGGQVGVGLLVALATWAVTGRQSAGWSAGYGALAVVLPAALFARGLTGRFASLNPAAALMGFFVWEMVKIALTAAMLLLAPRLIAGLSWPAMLVGLVLTMQVYWGALVLAPKKLKQDAGK
jgi:ATP synthase protein I